MGHDLSAQSQDRQDGAGSDPHGVSGREAMLEQAFRLSAAPMTFTEAETGRYLDANEAWLRLTGYTREELVGRTNAELGVVLASERAQLLERVKTQGLSEQLVVIHRKGGEPRSCLVSSELVPGQGTGKALLLSTCQDITVHREQARNLDRLTRLYACLSQINQAILLAPDRETLLDRVCEVAVAAGKFSMAWVGWNDPDTCEVAIASQYGDEDGYLRDLVVRSDDSPLGRGPTGTAIRTGQPVVNNDFLAAPDSAPWFAKAARYGVKASASFPVRCGGEVCAALTVYAPAKGYFGVQEIALMEEAASNVSFALDHLALAKANKETETQFRAMFEQAPLGMATMNSSTGRFLTANPRLGEILGMDPEALLEHTFQEFTHPDHVEADLASVQELATGARMEVHKEKRYVDRTGRVVWVRLNMVRLPPGPDGAPRHLSMVEDITEAREAREALRKAARRLQKIADRVPGLVYQYRRRPDGTAYLPYASQGIRDLYRLAPEDVQESMARLQAVHHPDDHAGIVASIQVSGDTLTPWKHEFRNLFPDGTIRTLFGDAMPELEADGSILWTGYITDITDRKRIEAQLQQAHKLESLGSLAGGIAHDMNNVLGAILSIASAHQAGLSTGHPMGPALETIREAALRGGAMVRSLLNFARQTPKEQRIVDLNDLLADEVRLLARTTLAKVRLEVDLAPGPQYVQGDPGELANVIMNLCVNAVDAMAGGGTLTLRTRAASGGRTELSVEDTGCGMSSEVLAKAMDPFFTTKDVGKGTGLGLALVYATVKAHQGQVDLQSKPGQGTRVTVRFPAASPAEVLPEAAVVARPDYVGGLRILLVDDDELVLKSTGMLLELLGHQVTPATCGEEALRLLGEGLEPDVVILDMNMPGLGGQGTLPRLRVLRPELPLLLATGRVDQEAMDLIAGHRRVALLPKPFSTEDVQLQLRELLG